MIAARVGVLVSPTLLLAVAIVPTPGPLARLARWVLDRTGVASRSDAESDDSRATTRPDASASRSAPGAPPTTAEPTMDDDERVVAMLERHDGRMKQQQVVHRTGWSKAKVSRLLSSMEAADDISRIQLGREKLVFLDGYEPAGARSPLHDPDDD